MMQDIQNRTKDKNQVNMGDSINDCGYTEIYSRITDFSLAQNLQLGGWRKDCTQEGRKGERSDHACLR